MKELSMKEISFAGSEAVSNTIKYIQNTAKAVRDALGDEAAIAYVAAVADVIEGMAAPIKHVINANRDEFLVRMGEEHDCPNCPNSGDCPIENLIIKARGEYKK